MPPFLRRRGSTAASFHLPGGTDIVAERARREALTFGQYKPDATTTGTLQDRSTLPTTINGDVSMTTTGQILENTIVNGYVDMKGTNQIVRNCWVRGPSGTITIERGLIGTLWSGCVNALIEDCWCEPQVPSQNTNGVTGYQMTVKRVRVTNGSDGFGLFNSLAPNTPLFANLYGCWVESLAKWYPDAAGRTLNGSHNDGVQIQGGTGAAQQIIMRGNRFDGYLSQNAGNTGGVDVDNSGNPLVPTSTDANSAIQLNHNVGILSDMVVEDNWLAGGAIGLNGLAITDAVFLGSIKRNKFTHDQYFPAGHSPTSNTTVTIRIATQCTIDCPTTGVDANIYEDNSVPVVVVRG
jgi:hypothetical protein